MEIVDYLLALFIVIACIWEIRSHCIPKYYSGIGMIVGFLIYAFLGGIDGFLFSLFGVIAALIIGVFLFYIKALNLDDIVLLLSVASFLGIFNTMYVALYILFFAMVIGGIILLIQRVLIFNKLFNACIKSFSGLISRSPGYVNMMQKTDGVSFPFIYTILPALFLHYSMII